MHTVWMWMANGWYYVRSLNSCSVSLGDYSREEFSLITVYIDNDAETIHLLNALVNSSRLYNPTVILSFITNHQV